MAALDDLKAYYYVNNPIPSQASVLADFTLSAIEATGIALDALTGPIRLSPDALGMTQTIQTIAGASPTEETLNGCIVVTIGTPNVLRAIYKFDTAVLIKNQYDGVTFEVTIPIAGIISL